MSETNLKNNMNKEIKEKPFNDDKNDEDIYTLLSNIKSKNNKDENLYEHLQKLYETKMIMSDDQKFIDLLEDISLRIKTQGKYLVEEDFTSSLFNYLEEFTKNAKGKKNLIEPLTKKDGDEVISVSNVGFVPDYYSIFQTLEWIGLSLGDKESYLLTNSLRNLSSNKNIPSLTFWGKIYGRVKDYFIAEATGVEPGGNINKIIHFRQLYANNGYGKKK